MESSTLPGWLIICAYIQQPLSHRGRDDFISFCFSASFQGNAVTRWKCNVAFPVGPSELESLTHSPPIVLENVPIILYPEFQFCGILSLPTPYASKPN